MEIKCELCGEKIVVADDLVPGQHVRCPFCDGKFSYAERPKEITEDDLREAIAVCRKNSDEWNRYYKNAPAGAKLYIALVFYGRVFASTLDKGAFVKAFKEIGPELKELDLRYLLQHEDDEAMREYLSDRLAASGDGLEGEMLGGEMLGGAVSKARQSVGAEAVSSAGVAQPATVWKFKKEAHIETRVATKRTRRTNRSGSIAVLVAAVAVIFIGVITYSVLKEPRPNEISNDASSQIKDTQQRLENKRNELRTLIGEKRSRIARLGAEVEEAQQQPKTDRRRLADELEKIGAENNFRAGEAKAKGRVRFNKAELALAIFKSKVFAGLYRRYVGTDVTTVVADCRRCVKDAIGGRTTFTQQEMDAVDRAADLRLQDALREVDEAIRECGVDLKSKHAEIKRLQGVIGNAECLLNEDDLGQLESALSAVRDVDFGECEADVRRFCRCVDLVPGGEVVKDEFVVAEVCDNVQSSADVSVCANVTICSGISQDADNQAAGLEKQKEARDRKGKVADVDDEKNKADTVNVEKTIAPILTSRDDKQAFAKRPRARTKCKSPDRCVEFADEGQNFCPKHKCQSYGCKQHIATLSVPSWVDYDKFNQLTSVSKKKQFRRMPSRYCKNHMCQRVVPQINDRKVGGVGFWSEFWDIIEDDAVNFSFFYCPNERMANGRYCEKHACKVPSCASPKWEYWAESAASEVSKLDIIRDTTRDPNFFKGMKLISGETCKGHSAKDPATIPERTEAQKMTCGDRMRAKEGKR